MHPILGADLPSAGIVACKKFSDIEHLKYLFIPKHFFSFH